jgi:aminoglycoside phosphotransferase
MESSGSLRDLVLRAERGERIPAAALAEELEPALRRMLRRAVRIDKADCPLTHRLYTQLQNLRPSASGKWNSSERIVSVAARQLACTASHRLLANCSLPRWSRDTVCDQG